MKRLLDEDVSHVLVPDEGLLSPTDARGIANEPFNANLLLIWGDVHEFDQEEGSVVKNALTKLDEGLEEQGYELYTLLEARSDGLENIYSDLPEEFENEFSKGPWTEYETIWTGELDVRVLAEIVDSMVEKHEVRVGEEARDALVEKTRGSKSAPEYIDTALGTADGDELTVEDVEDLSDSVVGMWKRQYKWLGKEGHDDELRVLRSMKALYDFSISLHSRLVRSVYLELFDGDRGTFKTAVESLSDDRRWVNLMRKGGRGADEVLDDDVRYYAHDTQLDAVGYETKGDAEKASEILLGEIENCVPKGSAASAHLYAGNSLYYWERYDECRKHWKEAIELDSGYGEYNKYELPFQMYERAIELDPEGAEAYLGYSLLLALARELDGPEEAVYRYEKTIESDPNKPEAYYDSGNILKNKLDGPEEARESFESSVSLCLDKGLHKKAIHGLSALVKVCVELNDEGAVVENCELALDILDEAPRLDSDGRERLLFKSMRKLARPNGVGIPELYAVGLLNMVNTNQDAAILIFGEVWNRRDEHETGFEEYSLVMAAGVVLSAHAEIGFGLPDGIDGDEILEAIDSEYLHSPENSLYEYLTDGETDTTTRGLRSRAEELEDEGEEIAALEHRAFAILLDALME